MTAQEALARIAEKAIDALSERERIVTLNGVDVVGVQAVVVPPLKSDEPVRYFRIKAWDSQAKVMYLEPVLVVD